MIEISDSTRLALATIAILGQPPGSVFFVKETDLNVTFRFHTFTFGAFFDADTIAVADATTRTFDSLSAENDPYRHNNDNYQHKCKSY